MINRKREQSQYGNKGNLPFAPSSRSIIFTLSSDNSQFIHYTIPGRNLSTQHETWWKRAASNIIIHKFVCAPATDEDSTKSSAFYTWYLLAFRCVSGTIWMIHLKDYKTKISLKLKGRFLLHSVLISSIQTITTGFVLKWKIKKGFKRP